jgi:hypothetical protein
MYKKPRAYKCSFVANFVENVKKTSQASLHG